MTTQVVILAAGVGSRLGRALPKSLTKLVDGRTIMRQQFDNIEAAFGDDAAVTVVVGYRANEIVRRFGDRASFVYNDQYAHTNTSKSLLRALRATGRDGVLWMNGDVVFDPEALVRGRELIACDQSYVTVNTSKVSDEEIKYTVGAEGFIAQLSKTVRAGVLGEAVGINYVSSRDKAAFIRNLDKCDAQDYFERGLELTIEKNHMLVEPMDISDLYAVEVDFAADLKAANEVLRPHVGAARSAFSSDVLVLGGHRPKKALS